MARRIVAARSLFLITILLVAAGLRFHNLGGQSFWNDEGNSARLSERSIRLILEGTASDIHPPLYYLLLRGWRELAGDSEFGLRYFSAVVGLATVALTCSLARLLAGEDAASSARNTPLLAMLLTALSPALVYYSQETRMYALLAFLALLSTLLLLLWLKADHSWRLAAAYVLTAAAGLYTHYTFPATIVAHNLIVLGWLAWNMAGRGRRSPELTLKLARWGGLMLMTFLLYLPWFPIFLRQAQGRIAQPPAWLDFLQASGRFMLFGPTIDPSAFKGLALTLLPLAALGMVRGRLQAAAAVSFVVPLISLFATGAIQPEFFKFMLVSIPFLAILIAFSWQGNSRRSAWLNLMLLIPLAVLLWGDYQALRNMYTDPAYARADYRGMAESIAAEGHSNAGIILSAPNQWEVFTYYHRQGAPVYPIPAGRPTPERIEAELQSIAGQHDRLYALFWGELQQDPDGLVEKWLDTHTYKTREEWVGDVRFVTYAVPTVSTTEKETVAGWQFGEKIVLEGYTVAPNRLAAGDIIKITLFWQTTERVERRFKVFLHLIDGRGQLIAQEDGEPGGGSLPTTGWRAHEMIVDNHGILAPAESPPGKYTLLLGLYELTDPADRLPITTPTGVADAVTLATVIID